mmetsp:Transcript_66058/g.129531  ORF Transcript_66058/g.129531 Transcript_66058/m.129531 type:complete len:208 (-) Transcript_66058:28-651(-)
MVRLSWLELSTSPDTGSKPCCPGNTNRASAFTLGNTPACLRSTSVHCERLCGTRDASACGVSLTLTGGTKGCPSASLQYAGSAFAVVQLLASAKRIPPFAYASVACILKNPGTNWYGGPRAGLKSHVKCVGCDTKSSHVKSLAPNVIFISRCTRNGSMWGGLASLGDMPWSSGPRARHCAGRASSPSTTTCPLRGARSAVTLAVNPW